MSRDETRLGRWSRRKRAAAHDPAPRVEDRPQALDEAAPEDMTDAEILEKHGLPDPDTLTEGSDYKAFLKANIPDHLKKRALRKLWLSNPALANLDGLLDYGDDFTDAAMVPDVLMTAYQVGKGIVRDIVVDETEPPEETDGINQETVADTAPDPASGPAPEEGLPEEVKTSPQPPEAEEETEPRPRRMSFRYD